MAFYLHITIRCCKQPIHNIFKLLFVVSSILNEIPLITFHTICFVYIVQTIIEPPYIA
jgi:hypothetical protein